MTYLERKSGYPILTRRRRPIAAVIESECLQNFSNYVCTHTHTASRTCCATEAWPNVANARVLSHRTPKKCNKPPQTGIYRWIGRDQTRFMRRSSAIKSQRVRAFLRYALSAGGGGRSSAASALHANFSADCGSL